MVPLTPGVSTKGSASDGAHQARAATVKRAPLNMVVAHSTQKLVECGVGTKGIGAPRAASSAAHGLWAKVAIKVAVLTWCARIHMRVGLVPGANAGAVLTTSCRAAAAIAYAEHALQHTAVVVVLTSCLSWQ
ncbi:hypothetical protein HaLaN_18753 [Haematococcus lacustris]|uniref:Uncharacterized protein n=1 Tax=Haematococcus lacustris TaxID=44745 RepID=A0A699ZRR1_HAELA|nr:hypothetical protein HaLaN_18753 [Haematococcus lacustris]